MHQKWIERARDTAKFHRAKCVLDDDWNMSKTAKALKRSLGSVCYDLKIAKWLKTHSLQIERCETAQKALQFIADKEKEIELSDLDG